jgi:hypothetical protein
MLVKPKKLPSGSLRELAQTTVVMVSLPLVESESWVNSLKDGLKK